jgi:hypothetical protein
VIRYGPLRSLVDMWASTLAESQAVSPLIDARRDRQATEEVAGRANIPTKKLLSAAGPNASLPTSEPIKVQSGSPEKAASGSALTNDSIGLAGMRVWWNENRC